MKKCQLILKPKSGLGNRIRAISSFIYLKNQMDADLHVIWQPDKTLKAQFRDIFKENPNFTLLDPTFKYRLFIARHKLVYSKLKGIQTLVKLYNNIIKRLVGLDAILLDKDVRHQLEFVKNICENNRKIFIITGSQCIEYREGVQTFVPVDDIISQINKTFAGFRKQMIGIHIRRTDHPIAIRNSPVYLFENKMLEYINQKDNDHGFFLATDDPEIENYFKNKFPGIVFIYDKIFGRDTKEGIADAVVDLFLLSMTCKIYGSYWSSYSEIASLLGNKELEILRL